MIIKSFRRLIPSILLAMVLLASLLLAAGPSAAQKPDPPPDTADNGPALPPIDRALLPKIEPQLLKALAENYPEPVPFIAHLTTKADLSAAIAAQGDPDPVARRAAIVNTLQQTAQSSQADLLQTLQAPVATQSGQAVTAVNVKPLWIVNAVAAAAPLEMVQVLAARPDVEIVRLDKQLHLTRPALEPDASGTAQTTPEWGISKIRADLVQNALGIDGSGVVVANIDSGVDWLHPDLQSQYRGYTGPGKLPLHTGNWHDATGDGAVYPVDGNGHGTHTMGTMVGGSGVGVAPGAQWIAVRAFDSSGSGYSSWLHEAFQWVMAPNGDPALAPDIVNNSWGSDYGASTEYLADVQALLDAGIFTVFSAGNNGSSSGTVGSPGSYTISFAVGATDINDDIALFSSRGPSPWGEIKPEVSAPGKNVRSTLPGGSYGNLDGTSMAAPHVSGLAALLLQASPPLSNNLAAIASAITSTAAPLGNPIPNNDYGWGRIDAYNAVMAVASVGVLSGTVNGGGSPLAGATVSISPHGNPSLVVRATTAANGGYQQGLAADTYDVTASAFGYNSASQPGVAIVNGGTAVQNLNLTAKPTGTLSGTVYSAASGLPISATISIDGAPVSITAGNNGQYSLTLPIGTYTATVTATRYRITQAVSIVINDGATVVRNFWLNPAPHILLIDSGRWYQESQIGYYQQALADLRYPADLWQITNPFGTPNDLPAGSDLLPYDIVIWSAPGDSPGYLGADPALEEYLDGGGKLLLSGQDVAYFDGGGSFFGTAAYFGDYLKAKYVQDSSGVLTVTGVSGEPLAGLSLDLSGGDGADNQISPDVVAVRDADFAGSLLSYGEVGLGGVHVGLCVPYRTMLLSFGFEAINSRADRAAVMDEAINWLTDSQADHGVELTPATDLLVGDFGAVVSHTVRLRNTGTQADTFALNSQSGWPATALPANLSLTTCQSQTLTIGVTVDTTTWHIFDTLTITAQSTADAAFTAIATRTSKSPAPVLLVDDDRWYSFADEYRQALEANHVPYDYWYVPKSWSGAVPPSPPTATLQLYPMVVWYTAYDWFQPLVATEEDRLAAYLDGGGRLMFSSQDYIYNLPDHQPGPFAVNYLGVLSHTEDFSSTTITGEAGNLVGTQLGPYALSFPPGYNNWTDALTPTTSAQVASRGQAGQPNSVINAGLGPGGEAWHTHFLAFGPELLTANHRNRLMQRSLGWLSWLGQSTVEPNVTAALDGNTVVYTATLINNGWDDISTAWFTATLPAELTWGGARSAKLQLTAGDELTWNGPLGQNQSEVFTYTGVIATGLPLGTDINQTSWLAYPEHSIRFDRVASVQANYPDLSQSSLSVTPTTGVVPGDTLTYTIVLKNSGLVDDPLVTATNTLPHTLEWGTVGTPSRGAIEAAGRSITWTTPLSKDEVVTLTYQAVISYRSSGTINNEVYLNDNINQPVILSARVAYKTLPTYLPIIFKN